MDPPPARRLQLLDIVRGITILWIVLWHFHVDTRGLPGAELGAAACLAALGRGDAVGAFTLATRAAIALPGVRLDVFLFLSGVVLSLARPTGARSFYLQRARALLPNYWLGSLAAAVVLVGLAALRAWLLHTDLAGEIHGGTRLALAPYRFEWLDLVRSLTFLGRFTDPRAMQVVAPSLWYVALVAQLYLAFPVLRALLVRLGPMPFLVAGAILTWSARGAAVALGPFPHFDLDATLVCFLPFRLISPALGMAAAGCLGRRPWGAAPARWRGLLLAAGMLLVVTGVWLNVRPAVPGGLRGLAGPGVALLVTVSGLWGMAAGVAGLPGLGALLAWTGRHSLSLLVVQDLLRFGVGTATVLAGGFPHLTWWLMPAYGVVALLAARAWAPLPAALGRRLQAGSGGLDPGPASAAR